MEILGILWNGLCNTASGLWNGTGEIAGLLNAKLGELAELAQQAMNIIVK